MMRALSAQVKNHLLKLSIPLALITGMTAVQAAYIYTDQSVAVSGVTLMYDFQNTLQFWNVPSQNPNFSIEAVNDGGVTALRATYITSGNDGYFSRAIPRQRAQDVRFIEIRYRTSEPMVGAWELRWSELTDAGTRSTESMQVNRLLNINAPSSATYRTLVVEFAGQADSWGSSVDGGGYVDVFRVDPFQQFNQLGKSVYIDYIKFGTGLTPIPEPSTCLAGALLLVPLVTLGIRSLRTGSRKTGA